jgi:hypothetical protein
MEQLAELADLMVRQLRNHQLNELLSKGFAQQVKIFAVSQGESTKALAQFKGLLEKVHEDVAAIRTTTTQISESSNGLEHQHPTQPCYGKRFKRGPGRLQSGVRTHLNPKAQARPPVSAMPSWAWIAKS